MLDNNQLLFNFEQLRSDNKLEHVMKSDAACQLQMWVLEINQEQCNSQRLLYAWVIPTAYNDGKWYKTDVVTKWSPKASEYKVNIIKFTFYSNGGSIGSLMSSLLQGNSLSKACEKNSLTNPPKVIAEFKLSFNESNNYVVRPTVFLETDLLCEMYQDYFRPLKSPSNDVSSFCGSLFSLEKMQIFGELETIDKPIDSVDELAKFCIITLKKETGLLFNSSDSSRLGNIEWLSFPLSEPEDSPIDFCVVKEDTSNQSEKFMVREVGFNEVDIYLRPGISLSNDSILIRCRLRNEHEIILDQIELVQVKEAEKGIRFSANQHVSSVQLTIWVPDLESNRWNIWYEQNTPLMREMNLAMGLIGLQASVGLSTLKDLKNSQKVKSRVQHYEQVKQTSYQQSKISGYIDDPWVPASRGINNYTKRLFPTKSKGKFFPKGWGDEGPAVLTFAEWFQTLTNNSESKLITIMDPYFDTVGVELIAHSSTTNTAFEVITCTQIKSEDDKIQGQTNNDQARLEKDQEPGRAIRIKKACNNLRLILSRLDLNIRDIRSNDSGKSQYFHDRYILIYDLFGVILEGYHLSNSLQAATRLAPLLVTPIPIDILEEVGTYVEAVRKSEPPTVNNASAIPIYSKEAVVAPAITVNNDSNKDLLYRLTQTSLFFSELLQDPDFISEDFELIKEKLLGLGLLSSDDYHFVIENEEEVSQKLFAFSKVLVEVNDRQFSILWESFSYWLANICISEKYLNKVCELTGYMLVERIKTYFINQSERPVVNSNETQEMAILRNSQFLQSSYKKSLYNAYLILDGHYYDRLYGFYHFQYATLAILYIQPSLIAEILDASYRQVVKTKETHNLTGSYLLNGLIRHFLFKSNSELIQALLMSKTPSLRALGSQALWLDIKDSIQFNDHAAHNLIELAETERILAYSEWIYHLRVEANRNGFESEEIKTKRKIIFSQIIENWHDKLSKNEKEWIINRLCGPSVGSWAKDIYCDLMTKLVDDNKMIAGEAKLFWVSLLMDKIKVSEVKNNDISFYAQTDIALTELCASILPTLSDESWSLIIKQIRREINTCNREIRRPFEKNNNFKNWNNTKKRGLWLKTFLEITYEIVKDIDEDKKLEVIDLYNIMDKKMKDTTDSTDIALSDFANAQIKIK
ncbi:VPA1262 family protein [Bacillaceae bacterium IKA-2]|nr:VPA1262 family protein [Bacillaceae bacterium IKA-2]